MLDVLFHNTQLHLPSLPSLRHLVLKSSDGPIDGILQSLHGLPNLETLELLCEVDTEDCPSMNVTQLTRLKHLSLSRFGPPALGIGVACRLHASWEPFGADCSPEEWLQSPVWKSMCAELGSFSMTSKSSLSDEAVEDLQAILGEA